MNFSPQSHKEHEETQSLPAAASRLLKENPISKEIVDCAFKIHKNIGPGLLESAYAECMVRELFKRKISFKRECQMPVYYEGALLDTLYKVDFLVEDCVIVELKSVERLLPVHEAQTLTYLKLSSLRLALLINFSAPLIKDGIRRFVL